MPYPVRIFLLVAAVVCFGLSSLPSQEPGRSRLVSFGLTALAASQVTW